MTTKRDITNPVSLLNTDTDPHGFLISVTERTTAGVPTEFTAYCGCGSWMLTGRGGRGEWDRLHAAHGDHKASKAAIA